jgi:hypothetical protein
MDNWTVERGQGMAYGVDYRQHLKYWVEQLKHMPTLHQGQWGNLKVETDRIRVWFRRDPDYFTIKDPPKAQIGVSDPDGNWHQIDEYIVPHLPVSPWGGREERERHERNVPKAERSTKLLRRYNREAWAIDQGWPYPLPYFYGSSSVQLCPNCGAKCSDSIDLGNSLRSDYHIELAWMAMRHTYGHTCPLCSFPLEPWTYDPIRGIDIT